MESRRAGKHGSVTERVVTHDKEYPLAYATCTDESTLAKNWKPEGNLATGEGYAVVQSGLTWKCATPADLNKFKAAKKAAFDEHHVRDRECDITVGARLAGLQAAQLYTSEPGAPPPPWPLRALDTIGLLLVVFGLTPPLVWKRAACYARRIDHRVHKEISFA